ncbi:MAG: geranylgeranylglycerol-phosphate geranylgeranyltransferase [Candidatus Odinarchaeota archaeon]
MSLSKKLKAHFTILRPFNSVMAGLGVFVGAMSCIGTVDNVYELFIENFIALVIAGIACALITAGGYVINDYYDRDIDVVNQPQRSIPSGAMSPKEAWFYSIGLFLAGLIIAFFIRNVDPFPFDPFAVFLAFIGVIVVYAYSSDLKRMGIIGNISVSSLTAVPFLYGGVVVQSGERMWVPFFFAFTISMGREIIKDVEDIEGDTIGGMRSLPMRIGVKKATIVGLAWLLILLLLIPIPFLIQWYFSVSYLVFVTIIGLIQIFIIYYLNPIKFSESEIIAHSTLCKRLLKTCMFMGIFAFVLTPFTSINNILDWLSAL